MTEGAATMAVQPGGSTMEVLEQHCRLLEGELSTLRDSEARLRQQHTESQRRERVLVRRLATKEQEMQDLVNQVAELKASQNPGAAALRSSLLDPAVNIILQKLKSELQATKARLEETQNELSAWKFTPDSNTGKRLMAKCRLLYQENEELGKMTSNGRLAKLEGDLALKKSFSDEVKKSQSELDDFLQELDEDVEGMQSTIYFLQKELLNTKETMTSLERENQQLSAKINGQKESTTPKLLNGDVIKIQKCEKLANVPANETRVKSSPKWKNNCESSDSEPELIIKVSENEIICDESQDEKTEDKNCERRTKGSDKLLIKENGIVDNNIENRTALTSSVSNNKKDSSFKSIKRNYDSDSSDSSMKVNERTSKSVKKVRRSSVLSLDYNDDTENEDALVISTNGDANISDVE